MARRLRGVSALGFGASRDYPPSGTRPCCARSSLPTSRPTLPYVPSWSWCASCRAARHACARPCIASEGQAQAGEIRLPALPRTGPGACLPLARCWLSWCDPRPSDEALPTYLPPPGGTSLRELRSPGREEQREIPQRSRQWSSLFVLVSVGPRHAGRSTSPRRPCGPWCIRSPRWINSRERAPPTAGGTGAIGLEWRPSMRVRGADVLGRVPVPGRRHARQAGVPAAAPRRTPD